MFGNIIASQFLNNNNWAFGAALALVLISLVFAGLLICGRRLRLDQVFIGGAH
jgi:spermidine/putrescine transport system permease protein